MNPTTVSDAIIAYLWDRGVRRIHGVVGGMAMYLNDAVAKHGRMEWIAYHGERDAGYAAVGEAKYTGNLAVAMVTAGCGSTNIITPMLTAYQDSVPVLVLSGADKISRQRRFGDSRQRGIQGCQILRLVHPVTKYATELSADSNPLSTLEVTLGYAVTGRPGPVWISVPLCVQSLSLETESA